MDHPTEITYGIGDICNIYDVDESDESDIESFDKNKLEYIFNTHSYLLHANSVKRLSTDIINKLLSIYDNTGSIYITLGLYHSLRNEQTKANIFYNLLIKEGNTTAMNNLAMYYIEKENYESAIYYFKMAVKGNNVNAMNNLGFYYHDIKDYANAEKFYLMAIKLGDSNAMTNIADMYNQMGKYDKAIQYYKDAIKKNNDVAMYNLGMYYKTIEKNNVLALKYFTMSMNNGNIRAVKKCNNLKLCT